MQNRRQEQLAIWIGPQPSPPPPVLNTISEDASSRRYFRFFYTDKSIIAVDSPPETENNQAFVTTAEILNNQIIQVPLQKGNGDTTTHSKHT